MFFNENGIVKSIESSLDSDQDDQISKTSRLKVKIFNIENQILESNRQPTRPTERLNQDNLSPRINSQDHLLVIKQYNALKKFVLDNSIPFHKDFIKSYNNEHKSKSKKILLKSKSQLSQIDEEESKSQSMDNSLAIIFEDTKSYNIVETDNLLKTVNEIVEK